MRLRRRIICATAALILLLAAMFVYLQSPDTLVLYRGTAWEGDGFFSRLTHLDGSIEASGEALVPTQTGEYKASLSIFGIPYKSITLKVLEEKEIIPSGETIGIRLYSDGLVVVGRGRVSESGASPAEEAGIEIGDVIMKVNGKAVGAPEDFSSEIARADGSVTLEIKSGDTIKSVDVTPVTSDYDGVKRIGLWVRDSTAGVGTLTYIDPDSLTYGALGHSISDSDTGVTFDVLKGSIEECSVSEIVKSEKGSPGELKGVFKTEGNVIGSIEKNTDCGIFGIITSGAEGEKMKIALKGDVKVGSAYLRTSLGESEAKDYEIKIRRVSPNAKNPSKGMIIEVTDETLLQKTGGIVQGMSGSPILRNGKIVGAVTHVLVNNPSMGYAIFAESMMEEDAK
jgi:stage IV sporulation protein B